jgi:hypothetical protein
MPQRQEEMPVEEGMVEQASYEEEPQEEGSSPFKLAKGSNAKKKSVKQVSQTCQLDGTCGQEQEVKPQVQPAQVSPPDGSASADLGEISGLINEGTNFIRQSPNQTSMANSGRLLRTGESLTNAAAIQQSIKISDVNIRLMERGAKAAEESFAAGETERNDKNTVGQAKNTAVVLGTVGNTPGGLTSYVNQQVEYARISYAKANNPALPFNEEAVRQSAMREGIGAAGASIAIRGEMIINAGIATEPSMDGGSPTASSDPDWQDEQKANMDRATASILNGFAANGGLGNEAQLRFSLEKNVLPSIENSMRKRYRESGRYENEEIATIQANKDSRLVYEYIENQAIAIRMNPEYEEGQAFSRPPMPDAPKQPSDTPSTQDDPIDSNDQLEDLRALKMRIGNPDTIF